MTGTDGVDFGQLVKQLELQELEAPGGVATAQIYSQLLALYLLHNDLTNAKFLWKRIPVPVKTANPELTLIWAVGQKMWSRDLPGIYESLNRDWSETVKPITAAILEHTRKRAFTLVANGYSSITGDDFAAMVGLPLNEAVDAAVAQGWQADPQSRLIIPKRPDKPVGAAIPSEQQLSKLTDFVSFLEN